MANPLASMPPASFLARYWQKKPLLIPQAYPDFLGFLTPAEIKRLACHPEVQARLVIRQGARYELHHGPFRPVDFKALPDRNWTVLVQELDHWDLGASNLLQDFNFIPHARLDDVMVSYAVPGGGVGPHFDAYDVFLLQGFGERRWGIAETRDLELRSDCELKILKRFVPDQSHVVGPGDLLYLPPQCAHHGVAVSECFTYSVGFRAPPHQEWVNAFLDYLRDRLVVAGRYADADLELQKHPAEISSAMLKKLSAIMGQIRWSQDDLLECAGEYLSAPKNHVFIAPPSQPLAQAAFLRQVAAMGLKLAPQTRILFHGQRFFINGESGVFKGAARALLMKLADTRALPPLALPRELIQQFHEWYQAGWLMPGASASGMGPHLVK
jgi:50S ribosomal protein L16 3-hydroxylase